MSRESSRTAAATGELEGSGWSVGTAFAVDIPLGRRFAFTPQAGYTKGSVRTDLTLPTGSGVSRLGTTDALTGWWAQGELSLSF